MPLCIGMNVMVPGMGEQLYKTLNVPLTRNPDVVALLQSNY